jgi:hypothetical protein
MDPHAKEMLMRNLNPDVRFAIELVEDQNYQSNVQNVLYYADRLGQQQPQPNQNMSEHQMPQLMNDMYQFILALNNCAIRLGRNDLFINVPHDYFQNIHGFHAFTGQISPSTGAVSQLVIHYGTLGHQGLAQIQQQAMNDFSNW